MLKIYTVCYNTRDYPGLYTVRVHNVQPGGTLTVDADLLMSGKQLAPLRHALYEKHHLTCIGRDPLDKPVIVKSWI